MYRVVRAKPFRRALAKLPANWQKRIMAKIREVAVNPYAPNNNLTKLQGIDGYRLRVGDWRVIYELEDERLVMLVLEVGTRGYILMRIEKITRDGKVFAILPMERLKKLIYDAEMLADIAAYDAAKARIARGEDELVPLEIDERRLAGESTVKIWREYRGLTQEGLAKASKVSRSMIAAIEAKHKNGGIATLKKLAVALKVDLDELA
jgi:mRNA interferase RelE/StbE